MLELSSNLEKKIEELKRLINLELGIPVTHIDFNSHDCDRNPATQETELNAMFDSGFEQKLGSSASWMKAKSDTISFVYFFSPSETIKDCSKCGATIGDDEYCDTCAAMEAEEAKELNKQYESSLL